MTVTAEVVRLLEAAAQISSALHKFISSYSHAPTFAQAIHDEIHDFMFILSKLYLLILESAPLSSPRVSLIDTDLSRTLTECSWTLSEIEEGVNGLVLHGKMDICSRIKWLWMDSTFSQLIKRLQHRKLHLSFFLPVSTSEFSPEATGVKPCLDKQLVRHASCTSSRSTLVTPGDGSLSPTWSSRTIAFPRNAYTYRRAFDSVLFTTRPYRGISNNSVISLASSKRPTARWSLFSGGSNTSVFSLPVPASICEVIPIPHGITPPLSSPSLLHLAAKIGHEKMVLLFLEYGEEMEEKDSEGNTALSSAVRNGHEVVVQLLLKQGANTNVTDCNGDAPLHLSSWMGNKTITLALLKVGADSAAKCTNGNTSLHLASLGGHEAIVQLLLEEGVHNEARNVAGHTPFHLASWMGHTAVVQLLLERGGDIGAVDSDDNTSLHVAALNGRREVVRLLLASGAVKEAKNKNGGTPLHLATWGGHDAIVRMLLKRGAEVGARDNVGDTPLHLALRRGYPGAARILEKWGAEKQIKNGFGDKPR